MGTEFSDNDALRCGFEGQRNHNTTNVIPFVGDQVFFEFAHGMNGPVLRVLAGMLKATKGILHSVVEVPVTWGELIAEGIQNGEVNLIGAMRIGGVNGWENIGGVVVQD